MVEHLKNQGMCDAFLTVAKQRYPEMLARVRENVARAMSGWLILDGHRAEVRWSQQDECFVGCLRGVEDDIVRFRGETPAEVQDAFAKAVRDYVAARYAQLETGGPREEFDSGSDLGAPAVTVAVSKARKPARPRRRKQ